MTFFKFLREKKIRDGFFLDMAEIARKVTRSIMADKEKLKVDGKNLGDLRVVDLKKELDKRGLSKSGSKKELQERLKRVQFPLFSI